MTRKRTYVRIEQSKQQYEAEKLGLIMSKLRTLQEEIYTLYRIQSDRALDALEKSSRPKKKEIASK